MEHLDRALELHSSDKLLQCARALEAASEAGEGDAAVRRRLESDEFRAIRAEVAELRHFTTSLDNDDGWTLSYDGAKTKVWYRKERGNATHTMRISGLIRAPLLNLAALLYEADLYSELLWFIQSSDILAEPSRLRRAAHFRLFAPWPLHPREVTVYGFAVDGLDEDGCVLVYSRSLKDTDGIPVPKVSAKAVRANILFSGYELRPDTPSTTHVRFIFNVDPLLPYIPPALINWASRTLCRWSLYAMESRARTLPPAYAKRQSERPIYEWFDMRLKAYWRSVGKFDEYADFLNNQSIKHDGDRGVESDDEFDVDATPDGPPRSLMASLLSSHSSPGRSGDRSIMRRWFSSSGSGSGGGGDAAT